VNGRCDSIHIERISVGGKDSEDFTFDSFIPLGISSSGSATISGTFSPSDSSIRTATIMFVLRYSDGSSFDTSFTITGVGIGVPPIEVAFGNLGPTRTLTAGAGSIIAVPIVAVTASTFTTNEMDLVLQMNTDLLTPIGISANGIFGSLAGSTTPIVYHDSVVFHLQLLSDILIPAQLLCEILCKPYVTTTLSTPIRIERVSFQNTNVPSSCLSATTIDSSIFFVLTQQCGDTTLAQFMRTQTLVLDGIQPNPTSGVVRLTFTVGHNYHNDGVLEIYNELGERLRSLPLIFDVATGEQAVTLDLSDSYNSGEGIRYLRIRTPFTAITSRIIILR
jgi:hypothetical protein